jgi:opacity protein-like surface antigen
MRKILITITAILITTSAFSQFADLLKFNSGGMVSLQWDISTPTASMANFVGNTSFSGFNIDYKHCYQHHIILGGRTGLDYFYENRLEVIKEGADSTISLVHGKNALKAVPIMFVVDYMIESDNFIPYAGIGIGTYYIGTSVSSNNVITESNNSFHFGVSPELGITIPSIFRNFGFNFSARYNYAFGTSKATAYSWFNYSIGLSFMY